MVGFPAAVAVLASVAGMAAFGGAAGAGEPPEVPVEIIEITYVPPDRVSIPVIIDGLEPATVLEIRAAGFEPDRTGFVQQCVEAPERSCSNRLPLRTDDDGSTHLQYLVTDRPISSQDSGACRLAAPRCTVEVTAGETTSVLDTVFLDTAPPPGHLSVSPRTDLRPGDTVRVEASGFQPGVDVEVMICAEPSTEGRRCGAPGPVESLTIGPDGSAAAAMQLDVDAVGSSAVACGRRTPCQVVARSDTSTVRSRPVRLDFIDAPTPDYSTVRLVLGLGVAGALLAVAAFLIRSGDWRPPSEADGSLIDEASFADLDAEADAYVEPVR